MKYSNFNSMRLNEKLNENVKHAHHYVFRVNQKHWAIENDDKRVWVCRNKMLPVKNARNRKW